MECDICHNKPEYQPLLGRDIPGHILANKLLGIQTWEEFEGWSRFILSSKEGELEVTPPTPSQWVC